MSLSGGYPCMDSEVPIQLLCDKRKVNPDNITKVFIEVQVREKRVYRTKSGLLLNHLHLTSPTTQVVPPYEYLLSWRWLQIDFNDILSKDVFRNCYDAKSLLSMKISSNKHTAKRFLKFFKARISKFCNKKAARLIELQPKFAVIVTQISTVCVYDLRDDREAEHSLKVCGKSCIREENPYGATRLPKGAFLFHPSYGSITYTDSDPYFHRQTCAICLDELLVGSHDIINVMCDHGFHSKCLIPWFNKVGTCPLCRQILKVYAACPP